MAKPVHLPFQLNALGCFEAAGRHSNFTLAARELGITQAAVSKQIKGLEERLNARLFERGNRAVILTPEGKKLFAAVTVGLRSINEAVEDILRAGGAADLTITTTVAMASLWLMPYIASFRAEHPEINIKIIASDAVLDLTDDRIDVAIRYGNGDWPQLDSTFMFGVRFFPVCSPAYLAKFPVDSVEDLKRARLLHLDGPAAPYSEWEWWFASNGIELGKLDAQLSFNNYPLLVQAAVSGQGVILAWGNVIDDLIEAGALVPMVEGHIPANQSYYLVTNRRRALRDEAKVFRRWLMSKTATMRSRPT